MLNSSDWLDLKQKYNENNLLKIWSTKSLTTARSLLVLSPASAQYSATLFARSRLAFMATWESCWPKSDEMATAQHRWGARDVDVDCGWKAAWDWEMARVYPHLGIKKSDGLDHILFLQITCVFLDFILNFFELFF